MDLEFDGDFTKEIGQITSLRDGLVKSLNAASGTLTTLSGDWQDSQSTSYITDWQSTLETAIADVNSACDNAMSSLNEIAALLNKEIS